MSRKLTQAGATRKAKELWGANGTARDEGFMHESTPERRAAALMQLREHNAAPQLPLKIEDAPRSLTVGEFLDKKMLQEQRVKEWRETQRALSFESQKMRYTVGEATSLFFHVYGQGDTWEECFAQADAHHRNTYKRRRGV